MDKTPGRIQWLVRCARRMRRHYLLAPAEAVQLAAAALSLFGPEACPQAAAGELMAQPPELYSPAIDAQQLAELLAVSFGEKAPAASDAVGSSFPPMGRGNMRLVEDITAGGYRFKVYPESPAVEQLLKELLQFLEVLHLPFAVGARPNDHQVLLTIGPLGPVERDALVQRWAAYVEQTHHQTSASVRDGCSSGARTGRG